MRIKDALGAMFRKNTRGKLRPLSTVWTERADDKNDIPLCEYPRPRMKRENWDCLNGWWDYAFTSREKAPEEYEGRILVPFSPETSRSAVQRTLTPDEALWYRRTICAGNIKAGERLILHFGAVDESCTVWLNRKKLGEHRGGYLPFSFDLTGIVRSGENELLVRVIDKTDEGEACRGKQKLEPGGMFYTAQSGIWQSVWTERVPDNYIKELKIMPHIECNEAEFRIKVTGAENGTIEIGRPALFQDGPVVWDTQEKLCEAAVRREDFDNDGLAVITVKIEGAELWSPERPRLYPVRISVGMDSVTGYFAMRSFGTGKDSEGRPCLTLNGSPYFFNGVLDQGYWPESLMTAPADEAMIFDISRMKELGFNMLRKHVKIEPLRWYYHCDRLGMAVWQDMVNGGGAINAMLCTYLPTGVPAAGKIVSDRNHRLLARTDKKERERFEEQLTEMAELLMDEPCVGLWVVFNEGWGQFDSKRLVEKLRQTDPTRPIDHASGWFDQGVGDICSVHNYFRELKAGNDRFGRAFVISEYGGITCRIEGHYCAEGTYGYQNEDQDEFPVRFREVTGRIRALSEEGLCGAVYTQVSDIEEEVNGLLTYDRKADKFGRTEF